MLGERSKKDQKLSARTALDYKDCNASLASLVLLVCPFPGWPCILTGMDSCELSEAVQTQWNGGERRLTDTDSAGEPAR
jgi:hypothetical protein